MVLMYINFVLILIIIIVLIIDIIYMYQHQNDINILKAKTNESKTLMDLREFKDLDADIKQNYNTYIVDDLMPVVNSSINNEIRKNNIDLSSFFPQMI